ncbi:uncharacterized protein PHACADRAFT_74016, partial [Phanerochaete carnosa HHB-10118-sp]
MDPHAAETLLEAFSTSVGHVWSPGSALFAVIEHEMSSQEVAMLYDSELQRLALMMEKVRSALSDACVQVATLRNRSSSVGQLPDDILYLVFHICAYAGTARNQLCTSLAISQTCSHWRQLSLSCSLNWSRVDLSNIPEKLARLLCEHSGNCALRFSWPVSLYATPRSEFAVKLCTENLLQVTELSLVATRVQLVPWVYEGSAPQIHEVFLQNADAFAYAPLILDCPLFRGETPHLHHLSLVGIRIPWATGNYRNLRT